MRRGLNWRSGASSAPAWAWIVIVVGALLLSVGVPYAIDRRGEPLSEAELERLDSAAAAAQAEDEAAAPRRIAFLGDSYTVGVGADALDQGFAPLAARALHWPFHLYGEGGTGYTNPGVGDQGTFSDRVADVVAVNPAVVVVEGGLNEEDAPPREIQDAARETFSALRAQLPTATVLTLGPFDTPGSDPESLESARAAIRQAADATGVTYVDTAGWLDPSDPQGFADSSHPTQAGHRTIAQLLIEVLRRELGVPAP